MATGRVRVGGELIDTFVVARGEDVLAKRVTVAELIDAGVTVKKCASILHYVYDRERGRLPAPVGWEARP